MPPYKGLLGGWQEEVSDPHNLLTRPHGALPFRGKIDKCVYTFDITKSATLIGRKKYEQPIQTICDYQFFWRQ